MSVQKSSPIEHTVNVTLGLDQSNEIKQQHANWFKGRDVDQAGIVVVEAAASSRVKGICEPLMLIANQRWKKAYKEVSSKTCTCV